MDDMEYVKCEELLQAADLPERVKEHCRAVSKISVDIAEALNKKGCELDAQLCGRAGLLHDISRTEDDHDEKGRAFLERQGLVREAEITGAHLGKGINFNVSFDIDHNIISENEVVYLADKLVMGAKRVTLQQRFESALKRYGNDPEAESAIREKYKQALSVQSRVEHILNVKLNSI
jgi:uncharacterized domain HDIG